MRLVFPTKPEVKYPWENIFQTFNVRTVAWGTESLSHLGPKIWALIPLKLKKFSSLYKFKSAIREWKPSNCPCRLCKFYLASVGFITVTNWEISDVSLCAAVLVLMFSRINTFIGSVSICGIPNIFCASASTFVLISHDNEHWFYWLNKKRFLFIVLYISILYFFSSLVLFTSYYYR